jgi:polyisoprenyl-phosphate glycosyltransferase
MEHPYISIVTPVYGCKTCLFELYIRLKQTLGSISEDFEIIFVNDASPDDAWKTIVELSGKDKRVKGINLSRNFGQHFAITAGLDHCDGDWIVVMDCDLQDQPEEILKLYEKTKEGYKVVLGRRFQRQDSRIKILSSNLYYKVFNYFTDNKFDNSIANFSIVHREVIENFRKFDEHSRAYPLFIRWIGFPTTYVDIEHSERKNGKSAYNWPKLINLAIDLIISHSNKPLKLTVKLGLTMSFLSFIIGVYLILNKIVFAVSITGWTSLMVSLFFLSGLLMATLGVIGLYIGKIYDEVKNRPLYIVQDMINLKDEQN